MKRSRVGLIVFWPIFFAALSLSGCASVMPRDMLEGAERSIPFEDLLADPDLHKGRMVILGGEIIETLIFPEKTLLLVLQRELGFRDRPKAGVPSKGRFIVSSPDFLDPAVYRSHRLITVVGAVKGKEVRTLGQMEYAYPVIEKQGLHLWRNKPESRIRLGIGVGFGL